MPAGSVQRTGDTIDVDIPTWTDQQGHPGYIPGQRHRTALYRDGELIKSSIGYSGYASFNVPAEAGRIRLAATATINTNRRDPVDYSTRVHAAWEFDSAHVDGQEPEALPLSAIRFNPRVDNTNRATIGDELAVPVQVQPQPGSNAGTATDLTVKVSYDDGKTWNDAAVTNDGGRWTATMSPPADATFVSLRGHATDSNGNTAEVTVIHAFGLKPTN